MKREAIQTPDRTRHFPRAKPAALAAAVLAVTGLSAGSQAEVVRVIYDGTITAIDGTGLGYAIDDPISGWFEFDSDDLIDRFGDGTRRDSDRSVSSNQEDLVASGAESDFAYVQDDFNGEDSFYVEDSSLVDNFLQFGGGTHSLLAVNAEGWFSFSGILSGNLVLDSSTGGELTGEIRDYWYDMTIMDYAYYHSARFDVHSISFETESSGAPLTTHEQITGLMNQIIAADIHAGVANAMDNKLAAVMNALDENAVGNDGVALNAMYAFCHSVSAQRGKKLSVEQANALIDAANGIIASINPFAPGCQ